MVLSKETDAASDASTVVAEAVAIDQGVYQYSPSSIPSTYNPSDFTDQLKQDAPPAALPPPIPQTEHSTLQANNNKDDFGLEGSWSHGLCHCFNVFFEPLFWMACCCTPLVYGQLMTRMKLNWCAKPDQVHAGAKTFATVAILFLAYLFLHLVGLEIFCLIFFIYCLIVYTRTRGAIRRQFRIPAETFKCCNGGLEDFCCGLWCGCCSGIQMARHTHNESKYPYEPCSPSGLPTYAPVLVTVVRDDDESTIAVV